MKAEWKVALARIADAVAGRQTTDHVDTRRHVSLAPAIESAEQARSRVDLKRARRRLLFLRIVGEMAIFLFACWVLNLFSPEPLSFGVYALAFIATGVTATLVERRILRARNKTLA